MKHFAILLIGLFTIISCGGQIGEKNQQAKAQKQNIEVVPPAKFKSKIKADNEFYLIDVRTPREYEEGTIMNAQNLNYTDGTFEREINSLDKDKTVYLFCRSGNRSGKAAQILKQKGFKDIVDLKGGILNWNK